jgi:hypothetical protein
MVILLIVLLLLALLSGHAATLDAMTWTEMGDDRVLLTVEEGHVEVVLAGQRVRLDRGDRRFLAESDLVEVARRSYAMLTFRGGAEAILCARTEVGIGRLHTVPAPTSSGPFWLRTGTRVPVGNLDLMRGGVLADTDSPSPMFRPLHLAMDAGTSRVETGTQPVGPNDDEDAAAFVVLTSGGGARVSATSGTVLVDDAPVPVTDHPIGCPHGPDAATTGRGAPVGPAPQAAPTPTEPTPTPTLPSPVPTGGPTPNGTDPGQDATPDPTEPPSPDPTEPDPTEPAPDPTDEPTDPPTLEPTDPPDTPPTIVAAAARPNRIAQVGDGCGQEPHQSLIVARITDTQDDAGDLDVWFTYVLDSDPTITGSVDMPNAEGTDDFAGTLGPFERGDVPVGGGTLTVVVHARDSAENLTTSSPIEVVLTACAVPQ